MGSLDIPVTTNGQTSLVTVNNVAFSSTTPLLANGVFTSGIVTNEGARRVTGSVYSDQAGSLQLQGSDDGVHWVPLGSAVSVTAATVALFDEVLYNALARAVYTNGTTNQATFRFFAYTNAA